MGPSIEKLRIALRQAELAGVPAHVLHAAAAELAELLEVAALADPRKLLTLNRGRAILRCQDAGLDRAAICTRLGISTDAYHRALSGLRDSRNSDAIQGTRDTTRKTS
jgi:hypothetical protein